MKSMWIFSLFILYSNANATTLACNATDRFERHWNGEYYSKKILAQYKLVTSAKNEWDVLYTSKKYSESFFHTNYSTGNEPKLNGSQREYSAYSNAWYNNFEVEYSATYSNLSEMPVGAHFGAHLSFGGYDDVTGHAVTLLTDTADCTKVE